jgi:hypothetical protein
MLHSKYHESRMSYIQKAEHWKYTKHTTRIRLDEGLEHSLQSLTLGLDGSLLDDSPRRNCVLSKCETNLVVSISSYIRKKEVTHPVVPITQSLLLDSLDIPLLLEHLGVFRHILRRLETVKVPNVRLTIEHRYEGRSGLPESREFSLLEER